MTENKNETLSIPEATLTDHMPEAINRTSVTSGSIRVAAYIRVSTDLSDQENSFETQNRYFTELLYKNPKWIFAGVYSDYGISGTSKSKRTGFNRLLRHCSQGHIDRIVCKSISRFTRNTSDFMKALDILHESHVTVFFEKEGLDTADPASDFILTTLSAIAQEESRSISANLRWSMQKRYPKGQTRNYEIYGYRFAKGTDAFETIYDDYRIRRVDVVPDEAQVVRLIFDAVEEGGRFADIARGLNFAKIKAPNYGKPKVRIRGRTTVKDGIETGWTAVMVSRLVRLERYCGDALLQKTYTPDHLTHKTLRNDGALPKYMVRDHHPAIISREQFEHVQEILSSDSSDFKKADRKKRYPFSGLLICANCGRAYNSSNRHKNPIWHCPTSRLNNGQNICHAEKIYEEQIIHMLRRAFTDRFRLLSETAADITNVEDILTVRCETDLNIFSKQADCFLPQVCERLENIQKADFTERDLAFLKRKIAASQTTVHETAKAYEMQDYDPEKGSAPFNKSEKSEYEKLLVYLEDYRERLELSYEDRANALKWMASLPEGKEGTAAFLKGLTDSYVKAFVLSITVHDPLHYTVRWFDDTQTKAEIFSDEEER